MKNQELKKKLIGKCEAILKEKIESVNHAMNDAQKTANEHGTPDERYDTFRLEQLDKKNMYAGQLQQANNDYATLVKIKELNAMKLVQFGAVVITSEQKLFISVCLGKVELDGEVYFTISPNVPLYKAIKDKKKNEHFEFGGKNIKILDVF